MAIGTGVATCGEFAAGTSDAVLLLTSIAWGTSERTGEADSLDIGELIVFDTAASLGSLADQGIPSMLAVLPIIGKQNWSKCCSKNWNQKINDEKKKIVYSDG